LLILLLRARTHSRPTHFFSQAFYLDDNEYIFTVTMVTKCFQAYAAMLMKSVFFWVITRRRVVIIYRRFGNNASVPSSRVKIPREKERNLEILTREDGTDTLSRNVGK
jgi:hypothetical protein